MVTSDGVLVIDKPSGPTSHDVVAVVRRALGVDRVGHTGTLDPLATGVLPLVIGRATRLASFLSGTDKEYIARIRFGASTDTYDAEGQVESAATAAGPIPRGGSEIATVLPRFRGRYLQQPPAFSAKKIGGTPAYKLARRKAPAEIKPVEVTVSELELNEYSEGAAVIRLRCSSGFYVRSLAHELGAAIGCGAHLEALRRTAVGPFALADAIPLADVIAAGAAASERLLPIERLLTDLPAAVLNDTGLRRAGHGNTLGAGDFQMPGTATAVPAAGVRVRLIDGGGRLIGLADVTPDGLLHPSIVLV